MSRNACCVARIALASGDSSLVGLIERTLADEGTEIFLLADDNCLPIAEAAVQQPDVVLLDRATLPDFARRMRLVRRRWPTVPIVVLSARDETDCARLLDEGADDVCVSGSLLLSSRLHAIARRARTLNAERRVAVGDLVLDRAHRRVWCAGDEVSLSPREYDVLSCLVHYAPRVVGRETLTEFVWGETTTPRPNTVEVYVGYLRRKLARSRQVAIETVRSAGYLLAHP
ncbi:MAG: response regulator transcription factor [bacterium]